MNETMDIKLESREEPSITLRRTALSAASPEPDHIIQSSLLADSTAPDGSYGWIVVFGCSVIAFWFVGTAYSWGVIQAALVKQRLSSPSTLSFIGSLAVSFNSTLAIINARMIRKVGARNMALVGVGLLGLGEILSGFLTHQLGGLFVTAGIIMGVGTSLCFMIVSVTPAQFFSKKRGLANGMVYAGGGLGGAVISYGLNGMIHRLGIPWTFRVLGFITLGTGLPAAWLIKERTIIRTNTMIEWNLFRDFRFVVLFLAGAIATFPLFVPPFFLPLYTDSLGLSSGAGAGLVAGFNFSSAIGRLTCGFMSDAVGPLNTLFVSLILSAGSMLILWPVSNTLGPLIAFVIINGMANGGFFATMPTVVGNVFGSARVSVSMGMMVTGWAGGYLMGSPIAGFLLNVYGKGHPTLQSYHPAMFYAGSMALSASGMVCLARLKVDSTLFKKL